mmetsp:Transcript_225/g.776  ORF Transcript_225/g.776 Transcript_225/m.776 type:complete len:323 (+) Transcript_225:512-1480(+)
MAVLLRSVLELVHLDEPAVRQLHASSLKANVRVRLAASSPEERVHGHGRAFRQLELEGAVVVLLHGLDVVVELDLHASLDHLLLKGLRQRLVEGAEKARATVDDGSLGAEGVEDASDLHANVASAQDGGALGQVLELEESVAGDAVLGAGNVGNEGAATGGDEGVLALEDGVVDPDRVGADELGGAAEEGHLRVPEVALVDAVEALHVGVALLLDRRPGEAHVAHSEAVVGSVVEALAEVCGVPHHLLGDAAHVHAGATHAAALHHRHLCAILRCPACGRDASAATTKDDQIKLLCVCHTAREISKRRSGALLKPKGWARRK